MNNQQGSLINAIKSAKIHKEIGSYIRSIIKPGLSLNDLASIIENKIKEDTNFDIINPLKRGIAFPVGLSLNNCAAHYTPNYNDNDIIIKDSDILKIDYGIHYNGTIIDSAFTIHIDKKYDEFIDISKKLTNFAIKQCGPDALLGEIGSAIEEYISSKEIYIDDKLYKLTTMHDLSGHAIAPYEIHAGKAVPNISIFYPIRMYENEYYAVEPFITTGLGETIIKYPNSHYMLTKNAKSNSKLLEKDEILLYDIINKNYSTLPFCQKWLYELNKELNHDNILKNLENKNVLNSFPPLYDIEGSIISQFEHTIFIKKNGVLNLNSNDFY
jgi:methionyl aminopeptidase